MSWSQIPLPWAISKSGLPQHGHFMYECAASGTKCMASLVAGSSFRFWSFHVPPQFRHFSWVLARVILNFVFLKLAGLSCWRANWRISRSTCWSSPIFTLTSATLDSFSFSAMSAAALITASASAHSCIEKSLVSDSVKHFEKTLKSVFVAVCCHP